MKNETKNHIKTDLCVIGGGSGGLSVAAGAVQMGAKVVLLEGHKMGGDCLNYGCVPSKALIAAAKHAHAMQSGARFGVKPHKPEIDYTAAKRHVAKVIKGIEPHDSVERFESIGVRVITEYGRFISPTQVQAGKFTITARRFVISTGSAPFVPPINGLDKVPYYTNETIFALQKRPEHLIVIGGGPIGMELAQAHLRLGCQVTVLEGFKALGKDDPELTAVALKAITKEGVKIVEGAIAEQITGKKGDIRVQTKGGKIYKGSHLLMAVGRKPNVDKLDLAAAGIEPVRGGIKVDASLKTSNRRVYAIGDIAAGLQFTHVASYHASVILKSALFGMSSKMKTSHIPWATYTSPELAQVGLTEAQAREKFGKTLEVVRFPYAENDRARAQLQTQGLVKVMVVKGRPIGASIVGEQAGELIGIWALAIANDLKMAQVAAMVAPYPTLGEINKRVAGAYFAPRLFESAFVKKMVRFVQKF